MAVHSLVEGQNPIILILQCLTVSELSDALCYLTNCGYPPTNILQPFLVNCKHFHPVQLAVCSLFQVAHETQVHENMYVNFRYSVGTIHTQSQDFATSEIGNTILRLHTLLNFVKHIL